MFKIGEMVTPYIAFLDHGSEINVILCRIYGSEKWLVDVKHGWQMRAANNTIEELYATCLNVKVSIGEVQDNYHLFVQDSCSYDIILGHPFFY